MTGAVIGTGLTSASLAFVAGEADALSVGAVTSALAGTLNVLVPAAVGIGLVNPSQLIGTETVRAIATSLPHHSPSGVARANFINAASSVARTGMGAGSVGDCNQGRENNKKLHHFGVDELSWVAEEGFRLVLVPFA